MKLFTDFVTKLHFLQRTELNIYAYVAEEELCAVATDVIDEKTINNERRADEVKTIRRDFFVVIIFSSFTVFPNKIDWMN